jgi:reactive intermediate/imine deaminase
MRIAISSPAAPSAIGPYSQAVAHQGLVWCSGQLGLDPRTGTLVAADSAAQAEQALLNLGAVCAAAGTSLGQALRVTIYLVDLADFEQVNAVYQRHFTAPYPARVTVQVAALPKGGRVEIDAVVPA